MSQENVEIFRRSDEAFNAGDIDAWLEEFIDPEIEWHSALPGLLTQGGTVYRGHEGVREMLREIAEVLDEMTAEYSEIHEVGDRVVAIGQIHTRGAASGVATDGPIAIPMKLSKPPGCRSRRCRRRTWKLSDEPSRASRTTWMHGSARSIPRSSGTRRRRATHPPVDT